MSEASRTVFLRGRNVNLRPIEKEDVPLITRWVNDPDVRHLVNHWLPSNKEEEAKWVDNLEKKKDTDIVLLIELADGRPIGLMGLHRINWRDRVATTGALIGEKDCWGRKLGSEAKMLLLHHAFRTMNLRKICSSVIAFNERSRRYSLRCGYKEEGVQKEHIFRDGKYWDMILLAVFQEDFDPIWERYQKGEF